MVLRFAKQFIHSQYITAYYIFHSIYFHIVVGFVFHINTMYFLKDAYY